MKHHHHHHHRYHYHHHHQRQHALPTPPGSPPPPGPERGAAGRPAREAARRGWWWRAAARGDAARAPRPPLVEEGSAPRAVDREREDNLRLVVLGQERDAREGMKGVSKETSSFIAGFLQGSRHKRTGLSDFHAKKKRAPAPAFRSAA